MAMGTATSTQRITVTMEMGIQRRMSEPPEESGEVESQVMSNFRPMAVTWQ